MFSIGEKVSYKLGKRKKGTVRAVDGLSITIEDDISFKLVYVHVDNVKKIPVKIEDPVFKKYKGFSNHALERIEQRLPEKSVEEIQEDIYQAQELKKRDRNDRKARFLYNEKDKVVLIVDRSTDKLITTYRQNLSKKETPKKRGYLKEDLEDFKDLELASSFQHQLKKSYKKNQG